MSGKARSFKRQYQDARKGKAKFWWEGGTLHKKPLVEWRRASQGNKYATLADFIFRWLSDDIDPDLGKTWKEEVGCLMYFKDPNQILVEYVVPMASCLDMYMAQDLPQYILDWEMPVLVLTVAHKLGFIGRNPMEDQADLERQQLLQGVLNLVQPSA